MSEEKSLDGEKSGNEARPAGEAQSVDALLDQHVHRWQQRVQIIAAVVAAFLVYMIWFMMHE